jgi:hypothetical protein
MNSLFHLNEFPISTSRIHEGEFVNSWSWNREFVKLKSWIYEVKIVNSWSWNREFMKLKSWIREFRMLKTGIQEVQNCEFMKMKWRVQEVEMALSVFRIYLINVPENCHPVVVFFSKLESLYSQESYKISILRANLNFQRITTLISHGIICNLEIILSVKSICFVPLIFLYYLSIWVSLQWSLTCVIRITLK